MDLKGNMLPILVILALIATMIARASGFVSMVRGGAFDRKHSWTVDDCTFRSSGRHICEALIRV